MAIAQRVASLAFARYFGELDASTGVVTTSTGTDSLSASGAFTSAPSSSTVGHYVQVTVPGNAAGLPDGVNNLRLNDLVLVATDDDGNNTWTTLRVEDFMASFIVGDLSQNAFFHGNPTRITSRVRYPEYFQAKLIQNGTDPIQVQTAGEVSIPTGTVIKVFSED